MWTKRENFMASCLPADGMGASGRFVAKVDAEVAERAFGREAAHQVPVGLSAIRSSGTLASGKNRPAAGSPKPASQR